MWGKLYIRRSGVCQLHGKERSKKSSVSKRKSAWDRRDRAREWNPMEPNGTPRRARRPHHVHTFASPRLSSPRLVSPRLALPRARTPLRSRSQSARSTFFLHVLFPRLYPVSRVKLIDVGPCESYRLVVPQKDRFAKTTWSSSHYVTLTFRFVSFRDLCLYFVICKDNLLSLYWSLRIFLFFKFFEVEFYFKERLQKEWLNFHFKSEISHTLFRVIFHSKSFRKMSCAIHMQYNDTLSLRVIEYRHCVCIL